MNKRKTIGASPLDAVVPSFADPTAGGVQAPAEAVGASLRLPLALQGERVSKERLTVHLSVELIDRLKNAVYWTPGLTLAGLAEGALLEAVDRLEGERGGAFAPRSAPLKGGRPVK